MKTTNTRTHKKGLVHSVALVCVFVGIVPLVLIQDSGARVSYCQGRFQDCMQACAVAEQMSCDHIEKQLQDWADIVPDTAKARTLGNNVGQALANKHDVCYGACKKAYLACDDNAGESSFRKKCACKTVRKRSKNRTSARV